MGALMYYPLGGKSAILCGVFMANETEKGGVKEKIRARFAGLSNLLEIFGAEVRLWVVQCFG